MSETITVLAGHAKTGDNSATVVINFEDKVVKMSECEKVYTQDAEAIQQMLCSHLPAQTYDKLSAILLKEFLNKVYKLVLKK